MTFCWVTLGVFTLMDTTSMQLNFERKRDYKETKPNACLIK